MHDLINDLATSVAGEFFYTLDDKRNFNDKNEALEKFHHLSVVQQRYGVYKNFEALHRARRLRTFLAITYSKGNHYSEGNHLSNKVLFELVPRLQFLRVLRLANYSITEVPQSIGSLKHMRYLNFFKTLITCLPEQVGDLLNLQSLIVSGCVRLSSLPGSVVKLKNLRHLYTHDTPKLNKMPSGIGGLMGLQSLSKVIVGGANGFKISDLKRLPHLQGHVCIKGLHTVINAIHAKDADLLQKKGLVSLRMEWSDIFDDSRNGSIEYEVLEGLRPNDKLKRLKIMNYIGMKFPSWVGDPSFVYLTNLTLRGCRSCTCLPTLGHLRSLKCLLVEGMIGLKRLGSEFLGTTSSHHGIAFPSLEVLEFIDMQDWEVWSSHGGDRDGTVGSYGCLRKICIINCPKLNVVEIELIPSLRALDLQGCSIVLLRSMVHVSPSIHRLTMMNIKELTHLHRDVLEHFGEVKFLFIKECDELRYLWESEVEACKILKSSLVLRIESCKNLVSLVDEGDDLGISPNFVRQLYISDCPKLVSNNGPNSMEKLVISHCHSITSLMLPTKQDLPSALKHLDIRSSHTLEGSWLLNNYLSSLGYLWITDVPNVKSFPEGCLLHLTNLHIEGCKNLESIPEQGFGFLPLLCLRRLYISGCKNLKSFPHEHLQSLTSLEVLTVWRCPSIDFSFPCGLWPPNFWALSIGNLKKPMSKWGRQNFPTSLVSLWMSGKNSGVVQVAVAEDVRRNSNNTTAALLLPPSLTRLYVHGFMELESLSKGLQHLTCLEVLDILNCPKLRDLPKTLLPSLSSLKIKSCPKLEKRCHSKKGDYWPIISQIPYHSIGQRFIKVAKSPISATSCIPFSSYFIGDIVA
ncbi:hypothetical protein OSB04_023603 [Centaurea solstitialis]|uniref:R13L1/DRL21-like LRR repeat region domain-containing protein n=1 Tax=Centaurea solstitialis TaxID=347529 RepID=A0AA38SWA5_9ASTR|nr:hypothetical protein OSB04_023603 [Centaurea solstitialis]